MALGRVDGDQDADMGKTRLRGLRCDSRRRGMLGIGGRAFCQPTASSLRSRQASRLGIGVFAGIKESLDFLTSLGTWLLTWRRSGPPWRRPMTDPRSGTPLDNVRPRLHLQHRPRLQRFTCGVALLRHVQIGNPPHANVTLSAPIGPSKFTYTASAAE